MGELLLNWLNDDVQLSRRIASFEDDFRNGYLFGELLAKHSQQLNFHQFIDKDDKASRVNNFSLLLDSFAALRVAFDSNLAMSIINRKPGVAKKVLYELKTQLERTNANHFSRSARSTRTLSPLKKIQVSKEKFDEVNREHFVKQLNELHPSQKAIIQERHLRKFQDAQQRNQLRAAQEEEMGRQAKLMARTRNNIQLRDTLKKSEEFRKQWEAENQEKWATNMQVRLGQKAKDQQFKEMTFLKKSQTQFNAESNALKSVQSDIADFERRNGLASDSDGEESKEVARVEPVKTQTVSLKPLLRAQQGAEKRLGGVQAEKKRHLREKRRRKMIVEQQKRYQMIEITRRERIMLITVEQTSKQEKELQYEIWRAWQNKSIIVQNCRLQEEKVKEKQQVRDINAQFKRDELLKAQRQEHQDQVDNAVQANSLLDRHSQVQNRKQTYQTCQKMVRHLLNLTEQLYQDCQHRNSAVIDPPLLNNAMLEFMGSTHSDPLSHYIRGEHEWAVTVPRPEQDVPTDPTQDNALPNAYVNNFYLGNILKDIFSRIDTKAKPLPATEGDSMVISLLGLDFAGKNSLRGIAEADFGFTVIEAEAVVEQRLKEWSSLKDAGMEVSADTKALVESCFLGKPIEQDLLIRLIAEQIKKTPKALLVDFPNSYQQAVALCNALGGQAPADNVSTDPLAAKINSLAQLVNPSETKLVERSLRQCGIDFAIWIDVPPKGSIDRQLGRRWKNDSVVHISDDVEPFGLEEGEKAGGLVVRNNFKLKSKEELKGWFSLFGTKVGEEHRVCWEQIKGQGTRQQISETFKTKFSEILSFKEKQKAWLKQRDEEDEAKRQEIEKQKKEEEQLRSKCSLTPAETVKTKLELALKDITLPSDFLQQVGGIWKSTEGPTVASLTRAFRELRGQKKEARHYLASVKKAFIELLSREDGKLQLIKDFQVNFNEFAGENEDMLVYQYTKEELHQRVVDLETDLLQIVEEKKEDALAERTAVMGSGWLEAQHQLLIEIIYLMVQAELTRYAATEQIITHYYAKKYNAKPSQPLTPLQHQLNTEAWATLDCYSQGQSPRVDKIVAQALRLLNRQEDVTDDKNKKGGKGAPPKKDDKKGGKGQVEEVKEPTAQQIELKKAVNTEKAILRQRINKISIVGRQRLTRLTEQTHQLYSDLQDLYLYTHNVETEAVLGVAEIFKQAIEEERPIEKEVRLNNVRVIESQKIRNFKEIVPEVQPAREEMQADKVTISGLRHILMVMREQAEGTRIASKKLLALTKHLVKNEQLNKLLSDSWRALTEEQIEKFINLVNHRNEAHVQLKEVMLFLAMGSIPLPTPQQLQEYQLHLSNYESMAAVGREAVVGTAAWFDEVPSAAKNIRPFERTKLLKELLFDIFAQQNELTVKSFVDALALADLRQVKAAEEGQSYHDYAFS